MKRYNPTQFTIITRNANCGTAVVAGILSGMNVSDVSVLSL
ncbi:MAG: hypothetical protein QFB86_01425 [Patescibacteria group bacterium]|nr:hypothetical protein [Patescibacteria group bacterium]